MDGVKICSRRSLIWYDIPNVARKRLRELTNAQYVKHYFTKKFCCKVELFSHFTISCCKSRPSLSNKLSSCQIKRPYPAIFKKCKRYDFTNANISDKNTSHIDSKLEDLIVINNSMIFVIPIPYLLYILKRNIASSYVSSKNRMIFK